MHTPKKLVLTVAGVSGLIVWAAAAQAAWAQNAGAVAFPDPDSFVGALIGTVVFGLIGTGMAILGFKIFDWVIPFDLEREIAEKQNLPVAILSAAMVLGICLIVAAAVS